MPGKPGSGGPVPKSSAQRRRRNKAPEGAETTFVASSGPAAVPPVDLNWHPRAREWFEALGKSAQASMYEPSDWAIAKFAADLMTTVCNSGEKPSAMLVAELLKLNTALLATEGDRRRLRVELARGPQVDEDEETSVANISDYMNRIGG